jgi:ABC-2 type transport system permease protein
VSKVLVEQPPAAFAGSSTSALTESFVMAGRSLRLIRRNHGALIVPLTLPVTLMVMFVYLFGGAIHTGTKYVNYVVPAVLLLCTGFGSALTAVSVSNDMNNGIVDRFKSMDVGGAPLLAGHVIAGLVRNVVSVALVFATALLIGFRPPASPAGFLGALGVILAYALALSWLSAAVGLLIKSPEAVNGFTFFVMFLPYPSSAFVPINTLPDWIRGFARHQGATPVIESVRGLLLRQPVGDAPWLALAWCGGAAVVGVLLTAVIFERRRG